MSAAEVGRDIYGNAVDWVATGRRNRSADGRLRAEMVKGDRCSWMFCRAAEGCRDCAAIVTHLCTAKGGPDAGR